MRLALSLFLLFCRFKKALHKIIDTHSHTRTHDINLFEKIFLFSFNSYLLRMCPCFHKKKHKNKTLCSPSSTSPQPPPQQSTSTTPPPPPTNMTSSSVVDDADDENRGLRNSTARRLPPTPVSNHIPLATARRPLRAPPATLILSANNRRFVFFFAHFYFTFFYRDTNPHQTQIHFATHSLTHNVAAGKNRLLKKLMHLCSKFNTHPIIT